LLVRLATLVAVGLVIVFQILDTDQPTSGRMPYLVFEAVAAAVALGILFWWYMQRRGAGYARNGNLQAITGGRRAFLTPVELPPPRDYFAGRQKEIDDLIHHLSTRPGPTVVSIHGPGGVGKTALAIAVAHKIANRFPDGQLFTQFTGYSAAPLPRTRLHAVLEDFVSALQQQGDAVPADPDDLIARYGELSKDLRLLVVLDDAPPELSVGPFVPKGSNCAVIVTGREPVTELEATECSLGPLSPDAALSLLEIITDSNERPSLKRLAESCGRLPLALRLAGEALAQRPKPEFSAAVDRALGVIRGSVPEPLDPSYGFLTSEERRAFRCLAAIEESVFAPWMLAAAADVDEQVADTLANRLVHAGLVERHSPEPSAGSMYIVHEHVRAYARHRAGLDDGPLIQQARLRQVDRARSQRHSTRADRQVRNRVFPLMMTGSLASALANARAALSLAQELADKNAENSARTVIAELTAELGNVSEAEEMARSGISAEEPATRARAYRCLGHAHRRLHRLSIAIGELEEARVLAQQAQDPGEEVRVAVEQAIVAALMRDRAGAARYCEDAERICTSRGEAGRSQRALVLMAKGNTLGLADDFDTAYQLLVQSRHIASEENQQLRFAHVLYYIADVLLRQASYEATEAALSHERGLLAAAEKRAIQALEDFTGMQHSYGAARCRHVLGGIAYHDGRLVESIQMLQEALETFHGCGDPLIEAEAIRDLSRSYGALGDGDRAERLRARAVEIFAELGYSDAIAEIRQEDATANLVQADDMVARSRRAVRGL
jgi:tetratricopeptide (TPR) repeat protein